jgi:hypothetical protein
MPWQYNQQTGRLTRNGHVVGVGYSGRGVGRNNPVMEIIQSVGPIPRGRYKIGPQHKHRSKGSVTMALTPIGHTAQGRTHFLIHGDSTHHPGDASEGCIVRNHVIRQTIAASGDTDLEVTQ